MATVFVEGKPYAMDQAQNLLHGCLSLGFNLPYFCWHPALGSVGACRQCAVKQFKDTHDSKGKIVMACVTPASEGTRISIEDSEAAGFRKAVIEGLMLNHPHDCPVCDEGGECHLQDMTVMTGHDYRRYRFDKRTFHNQYLGPLVNQEMNRCIQCYRCVRYYREYAGGGDLDAFSIHDTVFFGRQADGVLENEFSGNLVEICPTGVFTDRTLKHHYTRKWDQLFTPSICPHCALGCNTDIGERYGTLRRVMNRYQHEVNGYFLCDRGRFGYEFVNDAERIRRPQWNSRTVPADFAQRMLRDLIGRGRTIGIGSPRASVESNFALRELVGEENFYKGLEDREAELVSEMIATLRESGLHTPSLREAEECDAVLVIGEDVTNVAPRLALTLRQSVRQAPLEIAKRLKIPLWLDHGVRDAIQDQKGPLYIAAPYPTRLDEIATSTFHGAPEDLARLAFAVAHELDANATATDSTPLAAEMADALRSAKHPLVVAGTSCGSVAILHAAANVALAAGAALLFLAPECNTIGASLIGGHRLGEAGKARADTIIILENDIFRRMPAGAAEELLGSAEQIVVLDSLPTATTAKAKLVLPAATWAESAGTFISSEGRAQRFFEGLTATDAIRESWRWLDSKRWTKLDDVLAAISAAIPELAPIRDAAPSAAFRMAGAKIPRGPQRYSGRTAMFANINVSEPPPPNDPDAPLNFSMEGAETKPPGPLVPFFWSPGWNSIQATNFYQREVGGPLRGGDAAVRIFEPGAKVRDAYFTDVPEAFAPRADEILLVAMPHIFGSEELSARAPGIAELAPEAYVAIRDMDAEIVDLSIGHDTFRLPVRVRDDLPAGVGALPVGIGPLIGLALPAWGRIRRIA